MRHSNNVLVLIQPALAGPDVNPLNYWQPQCVLWPPSIDLGTGSRLLSLATGENWAGNVGDLKFDPIEGGRAWNAHDFKDLKARGHFDARKRAFGDLHAALLVGTSGSSNPSAMRLALNEDSAIIRSVKIGDSVWPENNLMVAEASGWDQVAEISNATTGRVLVVEYPPPAGVGWSRYWLKGNWKVAASRLEVSPEEATVLSEPYSPVPGLIRARQLIPLVTHPERFIVCQVSLKDWPGANRFLELDRSDRNVLDGVWLALVVVMVVWGGVLVSNEREGRILPVIIIWAILSPAILDLAGLMGRYWGVGQWPVWLVLCSFALPILAMALGALLRRRADSVHPLLAVYAVGLVTLGLVNPVWSFLSPVFAQNQAPVSYIAIGALFGYLAGVIGCLQGWGRAAIWVGRVLAGGILIGGIAAHGWWIEDLGATLFIPVAAILIGEDAFRWPMLVGFSLWPSSLVALYLGGFIWAPMGLILDDRERIGINLAQYVDFIASPSFAIFILLTGGISLFGYKFFFHQLKMLFRLDGRRKVLSLCAISGATFGLLHPPFLMSSLVLATGAILALLFDAVQTM